MPVTKTGAVVSIPDYGAIGVADIATVGHERTVVVRWTHDPRHDIGDRRVSRTVTHELNANYPDIYWRPDIGIAVVPFGGLKEVT